MTTDTHRDTDVTAVDTEPDAPIAPPVDPVAEADEQAVKVLAKARYDAFRLVTDARDEAEGILDEARKSAESIIHTAEVTAEAITDAARMQAKEIMTSPPAEIANDERVVGHREALDIQVAELKEIAERLDARIAQAAEAAPSSTSEHAADPAYEPSQAPVLDYSASVEAPPKAEDAADALEEDPFVDPIEHTRRGSFYSRRSAKLPSIGEAGGKSALDMMRSIRESLDEGL